MLLRVVFFNRSFYPDITATGQLLTELCLDLTDIYKCQVTVITARPLVDYGVSSARSRRGLIEEEQFRGIRILRVRNTVFKQQSFIGRIVNYLTYFILSIFASFKAGGQDIVVTLTDPPIIPLAGLFLARRLRVPLAISVRDIFPEASAGLDGSQNKTLNFLLDKINRFCLKRCESVIVLGKSMCRRLIEDKGVSLESISLIPDWADCSNIFPVSKDNDFSTANELTGKFVVMHAGNIGASSGLEFVIEAAERLKDKKEIVFIFIGEGIMKERLIGLAKRYGLKNVKFLPFQPRENLSKVFSAAEVFLVSLKRGLSGYSLPSKIYASLASGRPYIACVEDESEVAEVTREFGCGLICRPQDSSDLSEAVMKFFNDRELLNKMGQNSRQAALLFDRSLGAKAYYELFLGLQKGKKVI